MAGFQQIAAMPAHVAKLNEAHLHNQSQWLAIGTGAGV
jgi:hypothetical protein